MMAQSSAYRRRVYLAGPDVFLPNAAALLERKQELCAKHGFVGLSPFDNEVDRSGLSKHEVALRIGAANEEMIRSCDLVIANLTPFRGPSADVGTAYEVGFARALGLPVFAYTNVAGSLLDRTRRWLGDRVKQRADGEFADQFDMIVEDLDCVDNLMIVGAVEAGGSGAGIVINDVADNDSFTDLARFEACLELAARQFPSAAGF
jgi:nucleoside 2-deoxyribosyltransferase